MRKALLIIFLYTILISSFIFAAEDQLQFGINWKHVVSGTDKLEFLEYDGSSVLETKTKELDIISDIQNVARMRFSSNISGTYTFSFKATALQSQDDDSAVIYKLYFNYEGWGVNLVVGNDPGTTYPLIGQDPVSLTLTVPSGVSEEQVYDVFIRAELTASDEMKPSTYASTITIERIVN